MNSLLSNQNRKIQETKKKNIKMGHGPNPFIKHIMAFPKEQWLFASVLNHVKQFKLLLKTLILGSKQMTHKTGKESSPLQHFMLLGLSHYGVQQGCSLPKAIHGKGLCLPVYGGTQPRI